MGQVCGWPFSHRAVRTIAPVATIPNHTILRAVRTWTRRKSSRAWTPIPCSTASREQPEACRILADAAHARGLNVWAYSGYTFEQLCAAPEKRRLLEACDVLVDGPFLLAERSLDLRFRGSKNQRVLKVAELLAGGE